MSASPRTAVLLMGYGSPDGPDQIPGYLADVIHRPPAAAMVEEYRRRYALIGGSPQSRILESLRQKLERRFQRDADDRPVYLAMKHWHPNIADVLPRIVADGYGRIVAVPLSPFASTWILSPYRAALERGRSQCEPKPEIDLRAGWHLDPDLIGYWSDGIRSELDRAADGSMAVHLSAHSLPKRFEADGDPYPRLLRETSDAIAQRAALGRWSFTFQSAGSTTEPWLGPDITERILEWKARGASTQLVASFGFVFDHLEVLYDLDIVVRQFCEEHGVRYRRVSEPNDSDRIVEAVARRARPQAPGERARGPPGPRNETAPVQVPPAEQS